ncbi:hypothetical protein, partial [Halomonas cupida]|uniref:hypothetical protein n=1 Tax=Halomonas cupida TaxID=44933 RepID=UPI003A8CD3EA
AHLRQCGADDNQIDQDELFDCHVNSVVGARRPAASSGALKHDDPVKTAIICVAENGNRRLHDQRLTPPPHCLARYPCQTGG